MENMEELQCDESNKTENTEDLGFLNFSVSEYWTVRMTQIYRRYFRSELLLTCYEFYGLRKKNYRVNTKKCSIEERQSQRRIFNYAELLICKYKLEKLMVQKKIGRKKLYSRAPTRFIDFIKNQHWYSTEINYITDEGKSCWFWYMMITIPKSGDR